MAKINLKLFDYDGCLATKNTANPTLPHTWLIKNNNAFFESLLSEIQQNKYSKIIIGLGTNRQSIKIDQFNESFNKNGSCFPVPPIIQSYFESRLQSLDNAPEIVLDPFLMADIYGNHPAGKSYKKILAKRPFSLSLHSDWVFDHKKISLIYAHAHRVAHLHPHDDIVIDFYDDNENILDALNAFFNAEKNLLPKKVTLRLHQYEHQSEVILKHEIQGTSDFIDHTYHASIRYMACTPADDPIKIYKADLLPMYVPEINHFEFISAKKTPQMSAEDLLITRGKLAPSNKTASRESNYMTAQELHEAKLIPKEYVYNTWRDRIMNNMLDYLDSRVYVKNEKIKLHWSGLFFRNHALTQEKVRLGLCFLAKFKKMDDRTAALELVDELIEIDKILEDNFKKTHSVTQSHFSKTLNNIRKELVKESFPQENSKQF